MSVYRCSFPLLFVCKLYSELFHLSGGKLMGISCHLQQMRAVAVFNLKAVTFLLSWYLVAKACCRRRSVL